MITVIKNHRTRSTHLLTREFRGQGMQGGGNTWTRCGCAAWMFPKFGLHKISEEDADKIITCRRCRKIMGLPVYKPKEFKLFKLRFKTKKGWQTGYTIDTDKTAASLGLILLGKVKHTDIHVDVTELPMNKRMFLGAIKE